ncbi:MAG TPA: spermidine/putrescine ABC transporter ATP-binding protein [Clostridium sp.]|uniref:Spermidine/putrescine import ATP-binding protein PotA n=1 Tax=Clostridium lapidicellarium TaxID=3240931 RepID=A0ABV4DUC0_9CLOT|nr:ABC transporter ATP-binding protein [uncultured Clostridium sp.]NLU07772.1 ABC transporter ATP-binding protein [Clostridiales bacterium]HBC96539.1 spermidine/putrescine ABC transporter ATP-binding protein [Clostridium sp.]
MDNILRLVDLVKVFNNQKVIKNISLDIRKGEFLTILGPSGCGKTTILRMIAGLEKPTSGNILLNGRHIENKEPYELNINTVFQNYALFPHMNVYKNIAYGLKVKKVSKPEIRERVTKMLELVQLGGYEKRMPDQLSGGQKQRVAIARSLINNPKILLLDEPLSALDFKLRKKMQSELKSLQQRLGITFIYVTHDQEEALYISDRIVVMNAGSIEQLGDSRDIYERPRTKFVAAFIGESNLFDSTVDSIWEDKVTLKAGNLQIAADNRSLEVGDNVCVLVRPENVKYSLKAVEHFNIKAVTRENVYLGSSIKTIFMSEDGRKIISTNYNRSLKTPKINESVWIYWNPEDAVIINSEENNGYHCREKVMAS